MKRHTIKPSAAMKPMSEVEEERRLEESAISLGVLGVKEEDFGPAQTAEELIASLECARLGMLH